MKHFGLVFYPVVVFIAFLLITIPLIVKIRATPAGYTYTYAQGLYLDYDYYLALMRQGRTQWLSTPPFTSEASRGSLIQILYVYLGKGAAILTLPNPLVYYLAKYITFGLFCVFLYLLLSLLFAPFWRRIGFTLVLFSSSLPPLQFAAGKLSLIDPSPWWVPWGSAISRMSQIPHHQLSQVTLLAGLYFWIRFLREKKWALLLATLFAQVVGIINFPPANLVFMAAVGLQVGWEMMGGFPKRDKGGKGVKRENERIIMGALVLLVFTVISFGMIYLQARSEPAWQAEFGAGGGGLRHILPIGQALRDYAYVIGAFWLVIGGILWRFTRLSQPVQLIVFLFLTPFLLIPLITLLGGDSYRVLSANPLVAVGILTTVVLTRVQKKQWRIILLLLAFLVSIPGWLYYYPKELAVQSETTVYLPNPWVEAFTFLQNNAPAGSVVVSREHVGALLPALTDMKPYLAHKDMTVNFRKKEANVLAFYRNQMNSDEARRFLRDNRIGYVYWGWYEADLGKETTYTALLDPVWNKGNVRIYRVKP